MPVGLKMVQAFAHLGSDVTVVEQLPQLLQDIDRAITDNATSGLAKLVVNKGRILGASILGPHAGELVHEIVLAIKTGVGIGDISATIHAYPTLAQVHRRTVNTWYGRKLFSPGTRQLVRWINRLVP